jgi:hypothetical protein
MQALLVKDFVPEGSQRNVVVRVSQIWETIDQQQNLYELEFIVVHQLLPSEH